MSTAHDHGRAIYPARNRRFRAYCTPCELGSDFLRARPVGPSELRSRAARAHGNRPQAFGPRRNSHAHGPYGASGLSSSMKKIPPMGVKSSPKGWKSPAFGRKNTPYGQIFRKFETKMSHFITKTHHFLQISGFLEGYASLKMSWNRRIIDKKQPFSAEIAHF